MRASGANVAGLPSGRAEKNSRPKVLIFLDATELESDWRRGILHNDFIRQLKLAQNELKARNVVVLCSSDEAQRSWVNETTGRSIFAECVLKGLLGEANPKQLPNISADELCKFVQTKVQDWVFENRLQAVQQPLLLPEENGRKLAEQIHLVMPAHPPEPSVPQQNHWERIRDAWNAYFELAKQVPSRAVYTPHLWRQYRDTLIRAEQLYRAHESEAGNNLLDHLSDLRDKMRLAPLPTPDRSLKYSLPLAAVLSGADQAKDDSRKLTNDLDKLLIALGTKSDSEIRKEIEKLVGDNTGLTEAKRRAPEHTTELQFLAVFNDFYFRNPDGPKGAAVPKWSQLKMAALKLRLSRRSR